MPEIDLSPILDHAADLAAGFRLTVALGAMAWILAGLIGILVTALQLGAPMPVRGLVGAYVDLMRGMPSLVLILACYYLLPATGLRLGAIQSGLAALALYYGAYFGEAMRGAIAALPAGQWEAGITTGLAPLTLLRRIVLPQAIGPMIPPLTGLTIGLFKETALLSTISVHEFVFAGKEAISDSYAPFEIYAFIALSYWAASALIALAAQRLERRVLAYRSPHRLELRA
jgi:polar amino acid transport system permease protein